MVGAALGRARRLWRHSPRRRGFFGVRALRPDAASDRFIVALATLRVAEVAALRVPVEAAAFRVVLLRPPLAAAGVRPAAPRAGAAFVARLAGAAALRVPVDAALRVAVPAAFRVPVEAAAFRVVVVRAPLAGAAFAARRAGALAAPSADALRVPALARPPFAAAAVRPAALRPGPAFAVRFAGAFASPSAAFRGDARFRFGLSSTGAGIDSAGMSSASFAWFISSLMRRSSLRGSWPQFIRLWRQRVSLTSPSGRCARWRWM